MRWALLVATRVVMQAMCKRLSSCQGLLVTMLDSLAMTCELIMVAGA